MLPRQNGTPYVQDTTRPHLFMESPIMHDDLPSPVDLSLMVSALAGNMTVLKDLIGHMLANYPAQLKAIGDAINGGDAARLRQLAHTFKGSIANFHAVAAVEQALRLERCGTAGELTAAPAILKRLEEEMLHVRHYLEHHDWETTFRNT